MVTLECGYDDCSLYGIGREGPDDVAPDDERRVCGGLCEDGQRCGRVFDRLGANGEREHVESDRPEPPPPPPEPTAEEKKQAALFGLRQLRTAALVASDWTQLPDSPLTPEQKAEATAYRKALRDALGKKDPKLPDTPAFVLVR